MSYFKAKLLFGLFKVTETTLVSQVLYSRALGVYLGNLTRGDNAVIVYLKEVTA